MEQSLNKFVESAIRYEEAIDNHDSMGTHRNTKEMSLIALSFIHSGDYETFFKLLNHDREFIKLMASAYGLLMDNAIALNSLREIINNQGKYSFEAAQTIERWNEGLWTIDLLEKSVVGYSIGEKTHPDIDVVEFSLCLPNNIDFKDIVDFEDLDVRIGVVNIYFSNIIGVNNGWVSFCPNQSPPTKDEILAWAWTVRPDMLEAILEEIDRRDFKDAIKRVT